MNVNFLSDVKTLPKLHCIPHNSALIDSQMSGPLKRYKRMTSYIKGKAHLRDYDSVEDERRNWM